jgi:hypothetical protein
MVLIFSASSNASQQVHREVERAVHKRVQVLPFRTEDVLPSKSLEYFLSSQHWMDAFPPPIEAHYTRLCAYLKGQLAQGPGPGGPGVTVATPRAGLALRGVDLQPIVLQLAHFIGPLAGHLVKQAALKVDNLDDLINRLATEIDAAPERRVFEQRCRQTIKLIH